MAAEQRFLVTGAAGAVGAWTVRHLLNSGQNVVALSPASEDQRLRLIVDPTQLSKLNRVDTTPLDIEKLRASMAGITHVIHTETTTEDDCVLDPSGAATKSIGELFNVLNVAAEFGVAGVAFESSMSVFAWTSEAIDEASQPAPSTLLGCYHLAKELLAEMHFQEHGVSSIGLRANLIYGPGQDQGSQGAATRAAAAAVNDKCYTLDHKGLADFQFVEDVAKELVGAAEASTGRHALINLEGEQATMAAFVQTLAAQTGARCGEHGEARYPLPVAFQSPNDPSTLGVLATPLDVGLRSTLETLRWAPRDLYL